MYVVVVVVVVVVVARAVNKSVSNLTVLSPAECASFANSLSGAADSTCVPHDDCLGMDCDVTVRKNLAKSRVDVSLRMDPDQRTVEITSGAKTQYVHGDGKRIYQVSSQSN